MPCTALTVCRPSACAHVCGACPHVRTCAELLAHLPDKPSRPTFSNCRTSCTALTGCRPSSSMRSCWSTCLPWRLEWWALRWGWMPRSTPSCQLLPCG